jgi:hypothetical protein
VMKLGGRDGEGGAPGGMLLGEGKEDMRGEFSRVRHPSDTV